MRTLGIVVEYNPMHNGHVYHLQQSKKVSNCDAVVAVMSGHFLQRGEPALTDKWSRTDMALANGVDLVLELPVAYAVQPAEWFAYGAVATLQATGVVDALCFGSELGDVEPFLRAADILVNEPSGFTDQLQEHLKAGLTYPAAYAAAAGQAMTASRTSPSSSEAVDWMAQPNNSLGLHYVMALRRLNSVIKPHTIARTQAGYHDTEAPEGSIASATAIRRLWTEEGTLETCAQYLPPSTLRILEQEHRFGRAPMSWDCYTRELIYRLHQLSPEAIARHLEVTEGLEHRVKQALSQMTAQRVESLLEQLKTKRYTRTKLQRMLAHILLHHDKFHFGSDGLKKGPWYIRVLGFTDTGRALLKRMKQSADLPIVLSVNRDNFNLGGYCGLEADIRATSLYANAFGRWNARDAYRDYYEPPRRHQST